MVGTGFQEDFSASECLVWGLEKLVQEAQEKAFDYKSQGVGELELGQGWDESGEKTHKPKSPFLAKASAVYSCNSAHWLS